jgi:hypothetical protein
MGSSSVASGVCGGNWVGCCKTVASASAGSEEAAGRKIIVASAAIGLEKKEALLPHPGRQRLERQLPRPGREMPEVMLIQQGPRPYSFFTVVRF